LKIIDLQYTDSEIFLIDDYTVIIDFFCTKDGNHATERSSVLDAFSAYNIPQRTRSDGEPGPDFFYRDVP